MRKEPTILFCVGATKAGTSWLYDHLAAHSDCHLRSIKELRYFETVERNSFGRQLRRNAKSEKSLQERMDAQQKRRSKTLAVKMRDVQDWGAVLRHKSNDTQSYLTYLKDGCGARDLVADITPSYALLPVERLRKMAGLSEDTRFLYLMRDPLARLWSHIRMLGKRAAETADAVPEVCFALLERVLNGAQSGMTERGDYAGALQRLWAAVDPCKLKVMFMEDMLTPTGLRCLCEFLGIAYQGAAFDQPVHVGPALAMSPHQKERARALLRPQYEFVARHYPDIPENWRKNMGEGL